LFAISLSPLTVAYSETYLSDDLIRDAFAGQSFTLSSEQIAAIRDDVKLGHEAHCRKSPTGGNSKIGFSAVETALRLNINPKLDTSAVKRIEQAIKNIPCTTASWTCDIDGCRGSGRISLDWEEYFRKTVNLTANAEFLKLLRERSFFPVKISWEDIGRYENSSWGDRISDVGIWVRRVENDPQSAELALSVRRDSNFRDKVLMVPAENIKIHTKQDDETNEVSLPERLSQLGLRSESRDKNVIVSNQFAIVPVPAKSMRSGSIGDHPPRAAFNFSIYPYGSTNFVITDVIEGSSDAIVGPGNHQLLFANIDGKKAPFTASRAEDRQDLLKLESDLKAKGMDVDVQRYYLIQVPLKKNATQITISNMGTPPFARPPSFVSYSMEEDGATPSINSLESANIVPIPSQVMRKGLDKVAIGHGEVEGEYNAGSGYRGQRAEEPIRVTVVYFVTPVGEVTKEDMDSFAQAFSRWDEQALWGGSFVVKD
jgi:hypothetical protein